MMRELHPPDAAAITAIYNESVLHSVATFDTEPVSESGLWEKGSGIGANYRCWIEVEAGVWFGF